MRGLLVIALTLALGAAATSVAAPRYAAFLQGLLDKVAENLEKALA
jgi:hypothetical protein